MSANTNGNGISIEDIRKKISESEQYWTKVVRDLSQKIQNGKIEFIADVQAEAISNRQLVVDEISLYGVKIWRERQKLKKLEKARFEFYATSYPVKTSGTEKLRLIQADLADRQFIIDIYDEHVNHLRETAKDLEALNYNVKNKIQLQSILGGYE